MPNNLLRFWQELKRRKVVRVLIWYAGVGFVIIELAMNVWEPLNLPGWTPRLVIYLVLIGFPIAVILSWIFDITPEGISRTGSPDQVKSKAERFEGSIAVLPFEDMSPKKDQEYFCDGISEEIINALTHVQSLKVIARTSAFAFKGKQMDIREIGAMLNVAYILEGSIRSDGKKIRITAQLIQVDDGSHIWSESYDRELEDIFAIQESISLSIVEKLKLQLSGEEKGSVLKHHTESPEAYQFYLKGLYFWQKMTPEGNVKAQENYVKAIEADPEFALVYAILGSNFLFATSMGFLPPKLAVEKSREYTTMALEIDNSISVAHSTLGQIILFYDWQPDAAEEEILRSVQLNPNAGWDRLFYSWYLRMTHRYDEAIDMALSALEHDPFNIYIGTQVGISFMLAGRIDEAIDRQESTINIYPEGFLAHLHLGEALEAKRSLDRAIASYEKAVQLSGDNPMAVSRLASVYYRTGKEEEALKMIEALEIKSQSVYMPATQFLPYYIANNDLDKAYQWLEKACNERDMNLPMYMLMPIEEYQIPEKPAFQDLLEETGLYKFTIRNHVKST